MYETVLDTLDVSAEIKRRYFKTLDVGLIVSRAAINLSGCYLRSDFVDISRSNAFFTSLYCYNTGQM